MLSFAKVESPKRLSKVKALKRFFVKQPLQTPSEENFTNILFNAQFRRGDIRGSQFRRALMQNYNLDESGISDNIRQKCTFKFKETEDSVERIGLEHFATAILAPTLNMKLKQ
jgi:hypothetical protein